MSNTTPEEVVRQIYSPHSEGYRSTASTSAYGRPIAIVFGTTRIAGTIIQSGDYMLFVPGYGGIPSGMSQIALCEGEIVSVLAVWREKVRSTPAGLGLTIATGTLPQSPWAWMTTNWPALALGYGGVAVASCQTGHATVSTGELERSTFEIRGDSSTRQDGASTAYDADPRAIITALLCGQIYGLGWAIGLLGDQVTGTPFINGAGGSADSGFARYCEASEWFISLAVTEQRPAREIIQEVLTATDSVALWSEGKLKIRPLGEAVVTGGVTFTPYVTPQYDLGASSPGADFLADPGEPPVTLERVRRADVYNCFPVEFSNRFPARKDTTGATISEPFNAYNADLEDGVPDPVDVEKVGLRKASPTVLRCITRAKHAKELSSVLVKRALYTERNKYRFRLGWRFALLEPTDLVTLTDAELGLSRQLVRITEIEEQEDGSFDVVAQEVGTISEAAAAAYIVT